MRRMVFQTLAALCLAALLCATQTQKASAGLVNLNCTGTSQATYNPGLKNTPQTTTISYYETLAPCLITTDPTVLSGATYASLSIVTSCTSVSPASITFVIAWSNGKSSTVNFATSTVISLLDGTTQVTSLGTVTSGEFVGNNAVRTVTYPQLNVTACSTPTGITSLTGVVSLTLTSL